MRRSFRAPDAFSGDEDDNNGPDDASHEDTVYRISDETRLSRVKAPYHGFRSPVQRYWRSQWPARICSMLCCLVVVSFIAILSSFLYVILKGKFSYLILLWVRVHCTACLMYRLLHRHHDISLCDAAKEGWYRYPGLADAFVTLQGIRTSTNLKCCLIEVMLRSCALYLIQDQTIMTSFWLKCGELQLVPESNWQFWFTSGPLLFIYLFIFESAGLLLC